MGFVLKKLKSFGPRNSFLVVFCERNDGDNIQIISARKATNTEREDYEKELRS